MRIISECGRHLLNSMEDSTGRRKFLFGATGLLRPSNCFWEAFSPVTIRRRTGTNPYQSTLKPIFHYLTTHSATLTTPYDTFQLP